jgi:AcrR family transcriptional regulator
MVYRTSERGEAARAASQTKILQAAAKLFARKGYDATTIQDIVTDAGTSIGNVYFYFSNKEALLWSLVESSSNAMFDDAERHTRHLTNGPERIAGIIAFNTMTFLTTNRKMLGMVTSDSRVTITRMLGDLAIQRWQPVLADALPDRPPLERSAIAAAIWGVNRSIVEGIERGVIEMPTRDAAAFMVRWTMRALGVSASRAERIVVSSLRFASRHLHTTKGNA